jgi:hypothetical protein
MSTNWQSVDPTPAILVLPPDAVDLDDAHEAIGLWEHYTGKVADDSQRLAVEIMMAKRANGSWAARSTGREMPRQNGKGDELEIVELFGIVERGESILHSAHELNTVSSAFDRMVGVLEGHRDLRNKLKRALRGLGQQRIETKHGVIQYRTRTKGGGRGLDDISRLVIDEAQHAEREQLASATPILMANPNPQTNFVGTGGIDGMSEWWWDVRRRALSGDAGEFGYLGHTAEVLTADMDMTDRPTVDALDRDLWIMANPALAAGRGDMGFLEEQLRNLGPHLFAREHLGVWDNPPAGAEGAVIALDVWSALEDKASEAVGRVVLALDVTPRGNGPQWATVAAAGRRDDGIIHVESVMHRPGTSWVVGEVPDLMRRAGCDSIRIEKSGPASSLILGLAEVGVVVDEVSTADHARATGQFIDAVSSASLRHLGQQSLRSAVVAAKLRATGDADLWARRSSKMDITPLVAATLALGGVPETAEAKPLVPLFAIT